MPIDDDRALLRLLQLASPALPVGAYCYSEGLEHLIESGRVRDAEGLRDWLTQSLARGSVRLEAAVMLRAHRACRRADFEALGTWNAWLGATRETTELRLQSCQMGRSLAGLLVAIAPEAGPSIEALGDEPHFATAFGVAAAVWDLPESPAVLGYLQAWASNLVSVGVKSVPLGQTAGQALLLSLDGALTAARDAVLVWPDEELSGLSWGLALASMAHETQYSRLYRS